MWVKKNENKIREELQKEKELESKNKLQQTLNTGIWAFLIAFSVKILLSLTLGVNYSPNIPPPYEIIKLSEIPEYFPEFLRTGLYWSIGLMLVRFFAPNVFKDKSSSVMCDTCFKVKESDNKLICDCKGSYFPMEHYEWVEAKDEYLDEDSNWIFKYKIEKTEC